MEETTAKIHGTEAIPAAAAPPAPNQINDELEAAAVAKKKAEVRALHLTNLQNRKRFWFWAVSWTGN